MLKYDIIYLVVFMLKRLKEKLTNSEVFKLTMKQILMLSIPFLLMDLFIRVLASEIHYFRILMVIPSIMFTLLWTFFLVGISLCFKRLIGRILYGIFFAVCFTLFLTQSVYFSYTGFFFSFNLVDLAGEGSSYILNTIRNTSPYIYVVALVILALAVLAIIKFPKRETTSWENAGIIVALFLFVHAVTPWFYGPANSALKWDTWRNPRNVYQNFNDSNKSMKVCGLYEYSVRDFYVTFLKKKETESTEEKEFLEETYESETAHQPNGYTGILEGKNVIFLQLEGIDTWLLTEEDMPNLYGLLKESISFSNHYSYYTGGGSTFNSEMAVNTGLLAPISYVQNGYTFNRNLYPETLPKIFKSLGYSTNAFHMNTGEYYSRELNYKNWGYDHYYGLLDEERYTDDSYELDRELILNESFYEKMFLQDGPFMHYIITYTPHTPFEATKGKGEILATEIYGEEIPELTEEDCARMYAGETDHMVGLLLEALTENNLLDNTVIVAYADHYLYTLNDKAILEQYKETGNNLINQTPFFVWSKGLKATEVEKVNAQIDILPTVLNLFGVAYDEQYYIGNDIFDPTYQGYVFFSDYSWYDGNIYVENGDVTQGVTAGVDPEYIADMNELIHRLIQRNDLTQKYDYWRRTPRQGEEP